LTPLRLWLDSASFEHNDTEGTTMAVDLAEVETIIRETGAGPEQAIPILQAVQERFRFLPLEALEYIAEKTEISATELYGVATFYAQFRMTPVGEHLVKVCHGTACHVGGADGLTEALEGELGVKVESGGTTPDMKLTVDRVACVGCCSLAPVVMVDGTTYGRLDRKKVVKVIEKYR
jgi:NADH:ubiquinone oxidoreductase subunit E